MNYKIFMLLITPANLWIHLMGIICGIGVVMDSYQEDEFGNHHKIDD